jgi:uncharacterized protein
MERADYYVYVYIDPRSLEEFYYGKGRGSRKAVHLDDAGDTGKVKLIKEIKAADLSPIIKVVAAGLTEAEALLIEKTLIWKLGRTLTNISSGHFAEKFRPYNTLHLSLPGFDFAKGIYYVNVGEGAHRSWEDCRRYDFLSAGQGKKWSDQIRLLQIGDAVVAYLKGAGYVGVGLVDKPAVPVGQFLYRGRPLASFSLRQPNIYESAEDPEKSEYLVRVKWVSSMPREKAKFKAKAGLFTTQLVRASLASQPATVRFVEESFGLSIPGLLGVANKSRLRSRQ